MIHLKKTWLSSHKSRKSSIAVKIEKRFCEKIHSAFTIKCTTLSEETIMATVTLKGVTTQLRGSFPVIGQTAPDFALVDGDLRDKSLKDFQGKKKVLSIVPSLDTSVCSAMAKKFNEKMSGRSDVIVLLISADLPFAQKRFCSTEGTKNITPLSMMRDKKFAQDYGVLIQDGPLAGICARAVLVLDENNAIKYVELVPEITTEPQYDKVMEAL
jgi:thioredoxin-dependent peroxiredoxin